MTVQTEYLIDNKGKKKSVLMPIKSYQKLIEYIEDLEDSLALKKAKTTAKSYVSFEDLSKRLKAQGRIR